MPLNIKVDNPSAYAGAVLQYVPTQAELIEAIPGLVGAWNASTLAQSAPVAAWPAQYGTGCVQQLFCNQLDWDAHPYFQHIRGAEVSAHFFIERSGNVWQFVSCQDRAWHAGQSSFQGRDNCNDYSIGIELEGIEGGLFEDAQYESLQALLAALPEAYPINAVTGHEHIAPGRKADPGAGFDWARLARCTSLQVLMENQL